MGKVPQAPHPRRGLTPAQRLRALHGGEGYGALLTGLLVALAVHVIALAVMLMIQFAPPPPLKRVVEVNTDLIELLDLEEPVTRRLELDPNKTVSDEERKKALMQSLQGTASETEDIMAVDDLALGGLDKDLLGDMGGPDTVGRPKVNLRGKVKTNQQGYEVLDEVARNVLDVVDQRSLLVVILFDQSRSLEEARELFSAQLGRTFQDVNLSINDDEAKRLRWCVVGYGHTVEPKQAPTNDVEKIRKAIAGLKWDDTGQEKVANALRFCAKNLSKVADRMIVVLVTDEEGDDLGVNEKEGPINTIPDVGRILRAAKTRIFVLGREAMVSTPQIRFTPKSAKNWGYLKRGLPTRRHELIHGTGIAQTGHGYIPSGFGPYALAAMARQTGGALYIISERKSRYDPKDLKSFQPELVPPAEYDARAKASPLRATLFRIVDEAPRSMPSYERTFRRTWEEEKAQLQSLMTAAEGKIAWVRKSIDDLVKLSSSRKREKSAGARWEANYLLTMAQLYKMEAMLLQYRYYIGVMQKYKKFPTPKDRGSKYVRYRIHPVDWRERKKHKFVGGKEEGSAFKRSQNALQSIANQYKGTPWGEIAEAELRYMLPYRLNLYTKPRVHPPSPPRPKL